MSGKVKIFLSEWCKILQKMKRSCKNKAIKDSKTESLILDFYYTVE